MSEFKKFRDNLIENFNKLQADSDHLFEVNLNKDELWDVYLNSFSKGTNPIYREKTVHDCSCCRHFIKTIGNVVFIKNNQIKTIWDFDTESPIYQPVADALDKFVKQYPVSGVFVYNQNRATLGCEHNYDKKITDILYNHFYLELPRKYTVYGGVVSEVKGRYATSRQTFKRGLEELTKDSILTVLELISQNSLYRGTEWKAQLETFLELKREYDSLANEEKTNFTWSKSASISPTLARIKNTSIGTLLTNISEGMDLDVAVSKYEEIVAPTNYKRSKPIYTKTMLENAKKKIEELGYMGSLNRRFATLDDINVNNILFANRDVYSKLNKTNIFDEMLNDIPEDIKKYSKVDEIGVNDFIENVLPTANEIEVLFDNKLTSNLCSLITSENPNSKSMFKWNNNFSWAYAGNITDSMKQRVAKKGGKINGDLRFSIQWNECGTDNVDLDAHCVEQIGDKRYEIYFGNACMKSLNGGMLDVDIINPRGEIAVENIVYANKTTMKPGKYDFFVNPYSFTKAKNGFRAEIEFGGKVYSYDYPNEVLKDVLVATITVDEKHNLTIEEHLKSSVSSKEVWGINTNKFIPVQTIMYSPNYWDEQRVIGNQHVFFMLKDCVNPEHPNGFYNEYLKQELNEYRKVMEALGSKLAVVDAQDQLSGLGFSLTQRNEMIVKVKGQMERIIKVKF